MLAVIHIQLSHFAAFDVQLVFWVLVALYGAARVIERPDLPGVLLTGVGLGLALATKTSVLPLIIPIATAYLLYGCTEQSSQRLRLNIDPARVRRALWGLAGTAGVAALLFVIAMPYALLDWATFTRDVLEQSEMAIRIRDYPLYPPVRGHHALPLPYTAAHLLGVRHTSGPSRVAGACPSLPPRPAQPSRRRLAPAGVGAPLLPLYWRNARQISALPAAHHT